MRSKIKIGITLGDPSGVGPEIVAKALSKPILKSKCEFVVIGDAKVYKKARGMVQDEISKKQEIADTEFIDLKNVDINRFSFGKMKAEYGRASIEYVDKALELIKNKKIECLVTSPVSKEAINLGGIKFHGHTEYLADKLKIKIFVMMLLNNELKISLASRHIPLAEVAGYLNKEVIFRTIELTAVSLKKMFLIKRPRIVVCGLNPHASDNGIIGCEENKFIKPAIRELNKKLTNNVSGPLSAEIAVHMAKEKKYDCVIAMYHDQALIPLKLKEQKSGVNLTLGLPIIRTSPLHGTAFDIAGKGSADPSSFINSIKIAYRCALNQKNG